MADGDRQRDKYRIEGVAEERNTGILHQAQQHPEVIQRGILRQQLGGIIEQFVDGFQGHTDRHQQREEAEGRHKAHNDQHKHIAGGLPVQAAAYIVKLKNALKGRFSLYEIRVQL